MGAPVESYWRELKNQPAVGKRREKNFLEKKKKMEKLFLPRKINFGEVPSKAS